MHDVNTAINYKPTLCPKKNSEPHEGVRFLTGVSFSVQQREVSFSDQGVFKGTIMRKNINTSKPCILNLATSPGSVVEVI